jgi:hypothetical protein
MRSSAEDKLGQRYLGPPPPQSCEATEFVRRFLADLLSDGERFLDSDTVGHALSGPRVVDPKAAATRGRKDREVFAVWDGSAYRYPRFQFNDAGQPRPKTPSLIDLLQRDASGSNRDAALWLFAPDALLDGRTPAEVFPEEPERVLRIARRRRGIDPTAD